jgi:hypothetical protein
VIPAIVFAVGWATQHQPYVPLVMLAAVLVCPGWVAWVAMRARSDFTVIVIALIASTATPALPFIIGSGSRLERIFYIGLMGLALLVGILVAMRVMRRGTTASLAVGPIVGAIAMLLVLTPMFVAMLIPTRT